MPVERLLARPELPAGQSLAARGLPARTIDGFLRPLLAALLCDPALTTSSRCADLALRAFAGGRLCVPEGGYYISVHLPVRTTEEKFLAAAAAEGVALTRGSAFYPADSAPPSGTVFLRLPFQALSDEEFAEGVTRLASVAQRAE